VAAALKDIYRAVDAATGEAALNAFDEGPWGRRYPAIGQSWQRAWTEVVPFHAFPGDVRRILHTTNAIEALNAKLRRAVRARGHFPSDKAAMKLLFLVLNRTERAWKMPPREWILSALLTSLHGIGLCPMAKAKGRRPVRRTLHQGHGLIMGNRPPNTEFPAVPLAAGTTPTVPRPIPAPAGPDGAAAVAIPGQRTPRPRKHQPAPEELRHSLAQSVPAAQDPHTKLLPTSRGCHPALRPRRRLMVAYHA
jgi:hypothetical protein